MEIIDKLIKALPGVPLNDVREMTAQSKVIEVKANTLLVQEGHYVQSVPVVISGLIKVFSKSEERELLLYYIQPKESCVMSFNAALQHSKSVVFAKAVKDSELLLLPGEKIQDWIQKHPFFNQLFYQLYDTRYRDLMYRINSLMFDKLDKRVMDFLSYQFKMTGVNPVKITHKEIAIALGSSREVISRVLKKLTLEKRILASKDGIKLL